MAAVAIALLGAAFVPTPLLTPHVHATKPIGKLYTAKADVTTTTQPPVAATTIANGKADPNAWLNLWFPVMFVKDVPDDKPVAATVFERPLVLFREAATGNVECLADQCPHRLAPLSDGRLTTDEATGATRVECSYHGWQFSGCGRCTKLPQLDGSKPILALYDAKSYPVSESQGIVYVFIGEVGKAPSVPVPRVPELDEEGWIYEQDYMRDLPYDYTTRTRAPRE